MKIYLVGGAVRDKLLGKKVYERDWVVVGSNPNELISLGYTQVGKDFPVFLHPKTKEEYALARTEKKHGHGYQGFLFDSSNGVTLEEDLKRRDLTINAIAEDLEGNLFDPYNGYEDIKNKILRHVSSAFIEDPVRILRIARFAAQLPGFKVHTSTQEIMNQLVASGELSFLTVERVWLELVKALQTRSTEEFFSVLESCNANEILWPKFLPENYHKILMTLSEAKPNIKFASLCSGLSYDVLKSYLEQYKVPKNYAELAICVNKHKVQFAALTKDAQKVVDLLEKLDAWRKPDRVKDFCDACIVSEYKTSLLLTSLKYVKDISFDSIPGITSLEGPYIAQAIKDKRIDVLQTYLNKT